MEELLAQLEDAQTRAVVASALSLIGVPHHLSIHPGGVVVGADELARAVPLQWTPKGFAVTQFGHEDVAALGLPKVDLLGIRALTVLSDTVALIRNGGSPGFRLADIAPDDAATARLLATGDTVGVFQCESSGAQRTLRQLRATNLKDLAVANAFFKPGPATGGMAQAFIRRYRGEEPARYLHPALEPILQSTQGVLLFQEQVLRVAREVAGLSWAEADRLRKGMSKFQAAEMEELQGAFVAGCCRPAPAGPGFSAAQAQTLWRQVLAFAGYGFNQGHATAYADVSYRSAYLKAHWPAEFLCARLADWGGFYPQAVYLAEARRLGFEVRPPHVNFSGRQFRLTRPRIDGDAGHAVLWMGLRQVRDLRRATVEAVQQERRLRPFSGIEDLLARVPMQRKEWTHLVQCGALDGLGASRAAMLATGRSAQGDARGHQLTFAFADAAPARAPVAESPTERLAWELRVLGVPVSVHPVETVTVEGKTDVLAHAVPGQMLTVAGARLPGWTGGKGWFLGDPSHYAVAVTAEDSAVPKAWRPILVCGQWRTDEWGDAWLQVDEWRGLDG
jgi:DNA polymerase III alpha subunit